MSETVESLDIKINATAKSAKDEITNLVGKIDVWECPKVCVNLQTDVR